MSDTPVAKRGVGQPPFQPTDEQRATVRALTAYGIPQEDISTVIGCSTPTLHKYFRKEIDTAAIEANAKVAQSLFNQATKGENVAAAIFWLKVRNKWKEPPQDFNHNMTLRDASDADVDARIAQLIDEEKAAAAAGRTAVAAPQKRVRG